MVAVFERLVYAWSEHGLEGTARYQVTAATPRIRQAFMARAPLLELATRLAYWAPAPTESSSRVFGWQWTRHGLFVFSKYRVPTGHWAATGGFVCHIYHTVDPVGLGHVCSLAAPELIEAADLAAAKGDQLEALPTVLPRLTATGVGADVAELMAAALLSEGLTTGPLALPASSDEMFDGLLLCAERLPLPQFTRRSVSTSEAPERAAGFGLVGIGLGTDSARLYPQLRLITPTGLEVTARVLARTALAEPVRSRAALDVATAEGELNPTLFSAVLLVLTGEPARLTMSEAKAVLSHTDAAGLALEQPPVRTRIIALALAHWETLGSLLATALIGHPDEPRGASEIADFVLQGVLPHGMWPDLGEINPRLRQLVAHQLAASATGDEQVFKSAPSECLTSVLSVLAMDGSAHPVRTQLRTSILGTLSLRFPSTEVLATLSSADAVALATMLWDREQWREFGVVLHHLDPRVGGELCDLVGTDEGRRRLARWAQIADTAAAHDDLARFLVAVASAVPTSGPFIWVMTWLADVVRPQLFISMLSARVNARVVSGLHPGAAGRLGDLAAAALARLLVQRVSEYPRAQLTADELDLMRLFGSSSEMCAQLHAAALVRLRLNRAVQGAGVASYFSDLLQQVAVNGGLCSPAATLMVFDGVLGQCSDPVEIASIVESAAEEVGLSPAEYWGTALEIFNTMVFTAPTPKVRSERQHRFEDAVREGARRRHFGSIRSASSFVGMGLPRDIREHVDRWSDLG